MTDLDTGTDFVNGNTADATAVNARFATLETFLNTTGVHVYQAGTIETAALEAGAVTVAKTAAVPVCVLDKSGTQASGSGSYSQVTSFTTTLNVQGDHDNTANAIVVQTAGIYRVTGSVSIDAAASAGANKIEVRNNGAAISYALGGKDTTTAFTSKPVSLAANDVITLYCDAGGRTIIASGTFLSIEYIGAAS